MPLRFRWRGPMKRVTHFFEESAPQMSNSPTPPDPLEVKDLVGVDVLDQQHRQIAGLLNELQELLVAKKPASSHVEFLTRLLNSIRTHFSTEEQVLRTHAYPGFLRHKAAHEGLARQLSELREQIATRKRELTLDYIELMKLWMADHVVEFDRGFAEFLSQKKARAGKAPLDNPR